MNITAHLNFVFSQMEKKFQHLLIVFGGLKGLEIAVESDEKLSDVQDPADLFDLYLNTCPDQVCLALTICIIKSLKSCLSAEIFDIKK